MADENPSDDPELARHVFGVVQHLAVQDAVRNREYAEAEADGADAYPAYYPRFPPNRVISEDDDHQDWPLAIPITGFRDRPAPPYRWYLQQKSNLTCATRPRPVNTRWVIPQYPVNVSSSYHIIILW